MANTPIKEDLEYSDAFAAMILNEAVTGDYRDLDVDSHLTDLNRMILESGVSKEEYEAHQERMRMINEGINSNGEK